MAMTDLTKEELKALVSSMISMSDLLKKKRKELSKLNKTYKAISAKVRDYSLQRELKYIDLGEHQVHVYTYKRSPAINEQFLKDHLHAFFAQRGLAAEEVDAAVAYVTEQKKAKAGVDEKPAITLRQVRGRSKKRKKAAEPAPEPEVLVDAPPQRVLL